MKTTLAVAGTVSLLLWLGGVSGALGWGASVNWPTLAAGVALIALSGRLRA